VKGEGAGLGEVKVVVGGKTVPLPELLHAKGFAVKDGAIVKEKPKKESEEQGQDEESISEDHDNDKSGGSASSEDHGQKSEKRGHRP
jgi:hypothetical protein